MKAAVGQYVMVTDRARTDVVGKVVRLVPHLGKVVVRVENWQADGSPMEFVADESALAKATAAVARALAATR